MRRFVLGDIHGAHRALIQCFNRSGFDRKNDLLISLGDLCDGWPDTDKVFNELKSVRNLITILGNHDQWLLDWLETGEIPLGWLSQGGKATIQSIASVPKTDLLKMYEESILYYTLDDVLFVHGGIQTDKPIEDQDSHVFLWDRTLINKALVNLSEGKDEQLTKYKMVYVGHTPTINFGPPLPIINSGVCMLDTGAGWPGGVLTIMDIDSAEYFASDRVDTLYPGYNARG